MLSPEQATDLVVWAGSRTAAARATGIAPATIWDWLNPEERRERQRRYRVKNLEKMRERERTYRRKNSEKVRERKHRYYVANAEKICERQRQRTARALAAGLCTRCGKEPLLTQTRCWTCASKGAEEAVLSRL